MDSRFWPAQPRTLPSQVPNKWSVDAKRIGQTNPTSEAPPAFGRGWVGMYSAEWMTVDRLRNWWDDSTETLATIGSVYCLRRDVGTQNILDMPVSLRGKMKKTEQTRTAHTNDILLDSGNAVHPLACGLPPRSPQCLGVCLLLDAMGHRSVGGGHLGSVVCRPKLRLASDPSLPGPRPAQFTRCQGHFVGRQARLFPISNPRALLGPDDPLGGWLVVVVPTLPRSPRRLAAHHQGLGQRGCFEPKAKYALRSPSLDQTRNFFVLLRFVGLLFLRLGLCPFRTSDKEAV